VWRSSRPAAVAKRLDLFGVAFVGFASLRDPARSVIGAVPPVAFADRRSEVIAVPASVAVFWLPPPSPGCAGPFWSWTRPASSPHPDRHVLTVTGTC
jgi:hypothetical protein